MINMLADIANGIGPPDDMFKTTNSEIIIKTIISILIIGIFVCFIFIIKDALKERIIKKNKKAKEKNNEEERK